VIEKAVKIEYACYYSNPQEFIAAAEVSDVRI
jgi:hypothetical protein